MQFRYSHTHGHCSTCVLITTTYWCVTLRGLSNRADFRKVNKLDQCIDVNCVCFLDQLMNESRSQFFVFSFIFFKIKYIGREYNGCYCFTVTHSHFIDLSVSSHGLSLTLRPCCRAALIWCLTLPDMQDWKLYRNISLLLVHKDPWSASYKPFLLLNAVGKSLYLSYILLSLQLWVCGSAFCTAPSHRVQHFSCPYSHIFW